MKDLNETNNTEEKTVYVRISKKNDLEIIEVSALDLNDALKKTFKMGHYPLASSYSRENLNEDNCPKTVWDL